MVLRQVFRARFPLSPICRRTDLPPWPIRRQPIQPARISLIGHCETETMDRSRKKRSAISGNRGQALVPIVFIMIILTVLAVGLATTAARELRAAGNFTAQTQRFYAARGALNYTMAALAQTSNNGSTYGIVPAGPD